MTEESRSLRLSAETLSQTFSDTWWENFGIHVPDFDQMPAAEKEARKEKVTRFLFQKKVAVFDDLNFSLLKGDYVSDPHFRGALEKIEQILNSVNPLTPHSDDVQALLDAELNDGFIKSLHFALQSYRELLTHLERRFKLDTREYLFSDENLSSLRQAELAGFRSDIELNFFLCNRDTAFLDHFLTLPSACFEELRALRHKVEKELNVKRYAAVLRFKIDFLIAKIILRRIHEKKVLEQKTTTLYVIESLQDRIVDPRTLVDETFLSEIDFIQNHYELNENWRAQIREQVNDFKNMEMAALSMRQIHQLIKFYKDVVFDYTSVHGLRKEVERRWRSREKKGHLYNYYCYSVSLIYAINNEFSLFLDQKGTTEETAEERYAEVMRFAQLTNINNFFPQVRYIKFLIQRLEASRDQRGLFTNLEKARATIQKCEELYKVYQANIEWSRENYNYVFLLPAEDSAYAVKNKDVGELFVSSTFLLPLVKQKYMQESDEYNSRLIAFHTQISVLENVKPEIEKLHELKGELQAQKKAFEDQQADIKNSQLRSLEIIGIFTAIVTFVASSIPSFKFIDSALHALLFMFALSSGLSFFVYMLLLILKGDKDWSSSQKRFIAILVIICGAAWGGLLIFNKELSLKPLNSDNQYQIDLRLQPDTTMRITLPRMSDTSGSDTVIQSRK